MSRDEKMPMDCARFEEILHDLDRRGILDRALRESALAHAESCGRCARLLLEAESLDFGLRTLAAQDASLEAPPRVEAALLREFRRKKIATPFRTLSWRLAALGAAAAVILALGLLIYYKPWRGPIPQGNIARNPVVAQPQPGVAPNNSTNPVQASAVSGSQGGSENAEAATAPATDFVPLPYADRSATLEGGAVVRVVLSRQALASLGVPVVDVENGSPVAADLIVTEDGTPQAIRLVAQENTD